MGEIVGAALVSHVPPLVLPEATRLEMNGGKDFTILEGLHRIRKEIDALQPDTIVVLDSHWFTTFEFVVSAHDRRSGHFTSEELPRGNPQMPYDLPGAPAGTEGKVLLANGFNWKRHRVLFRTGAEIGDLDHRHITATGRSAKRLAKAARAAKNA